MLHNKSRGNRLVGSGEEEFEGFLPFIGGRPPWSCDQHYVIRFSLFLYLKVFIKIGSDRHSSF